MQKRQRPSLVHALAVAGLCAWAVAAALAAGPARDGVAGAAPAPIRAATAGHPATAQGARRGQAAAVPAAAYVGSDTCLACHDDQRRVYELTAHGKAADPRSPAAGRGCESCHGPGEKHVEDPSSNTTIHKFSKMAPREVNETCLSCHTRANQAMWGGSPHDARNIACTTCHSVHQPQSAAAQLKTRTEGELCASCHRVQSLKMKRVSHMPVPEGKLECSSCHNPHGSSNVKQLRVGNWVNESCVSCHAEKRGPFLFEHAAGRESCVSCHDPHGSSNDRLLVAKLPMLCQRCHIGTRHPSTIYDNLAVGSKSPRIINRACVNCHSQIHGSNHPSGQSLTR